MSISVVMCAYTEDRWDLLTQALLSVQHQSLPPTEVIVVIDHNEALFRRMLKHAELQDLDHVAIVQNRFARGLSGARNTGLALTTETVVAFIDDDAEATHDWLSLLVEPFDDPQVVSVGGSIHPVWPGFRPTWFPREFDWVVGCTYRGMPTVRSDVRNPIGANMAFRRQPLQLIGGFDTSVGRVGARTQGCEETEAAIRVCALNLNYRVVFEPKAVVHHHVGSGRTSWRYFRDRCFAEGLSKAQVARLAGSAAALETERAYVRSVLPRAMRTSLSSAVKMRSPAVARPAGAVLAGLTYTGAGYLVGLTRNRSYLPQMSNAN